MRKGLQQATIFGAFKVGTEEQRAPIEATLPCKCYYCGESFSAPGPLAVHKLAKHGNKVAAETKIFEASLSMQTRSLLQQIAQEKKPEEVPVEAEEEEKVKPEVTAGKKRTRGQPKRYCYTLKTKVNVIKLVERIQEEVVEAADDAGVEIPSLVDLLKRSDLQAMGIPINNIYKWMKKRNKLFVAFAQVHKKNVKGLKAAKSIGSGRSPRLLQTEAAVKRIVFEKRENHLRVPRGSVKELIKSIAAELEPAAFAKMKFSVHYFRSALKRMSLTVRSVSSSKNIGNEDAVQYGRFMCNQLMELRKTGSCRHLGVVSWKDGFIPDSVFGFFSPNQIFCIDEVPFNFAEDGKTVVVSGSDAAVRCLRGTESALALLSFVPLLLESYRKLC